MGQVVAERKGREVMTVDQRTEDAFLDYVLDLARKEAAAPRVRQDARDVTAQDGPEGPRKEG